jgi:serine/threonine protein kinase
MAGRSGSRSRSTIALDTALDDSFDCTELSPSSEWRELSDGGYSEVFKALLLGVPVAVKQATSRKKTSGEALMREMRYLRLIGPHPNIVQPYGAFIEHSKLHLVMQYTRHCLRSDRVARQCDPIRVMAGVARALVRIHSLGIIHRDLKVALASRHLLLVTAPGDRSATLLLLW